MFIFVRRFLANLPPPLQQKILFEWALELFLLKAEACQFSGDILLFYLWKDQAARPTPCHFPIYVFPRLELAYKIFHL